MACCAWPGTRFAPAQGASSAHVWSLRDVTQQKLAEQMRNQFVDTATHELRTPLANIKAYAETLALTDVHRRRAAEGVLQHHQQRGDAAGAVHRRPAQHQQHGSRRPVARPAGDRHRAAVRRGARQGRAADAAKADRVRDARCRRRCPKLQLDKDKIIAVLVNLLGNAAKYTPEGGRVRFKVHSRDRRSCRSPWKTPASASRRKNCRKCSTSSSAAPIRACRPQTGSGLGLSLAQEVVRLHGGELTVESELNKGSTFHHLACPLSLNGGCRRCSSETSKAPWTSSAAPSPIDVEHVRSAETVLVQQCLGRGQPARGGRPANRSR